MGSCVSSASPGTSTRPCETKGIIFFRTGVSLLGRGRHRGRGAALSQGDPLREVPQHNDVPDALDPPIRDAHRAAPLDEEGIRLPMKMPSTAPLSTSTTRL